MKYWMLILSVLSLHVFAQESAITNRVCKKDSANVQVMIESCKLGMRVLQGLYSAQDQARFPKEVDLTTLEQALREGKIEIPNTSEFAQLDTERRADFLYRKMMNATGQPLPVLKVPQIRENSGKGGVHFSTGTRGGGFGDETSLTGDLWY